MFGKSKSEGVYEKLYRQEIVYSKNLENKAIQIALMAEDLLIRCKQADVDIRRYKDTIKNLKQLEVLMSSRDVSLSQTIK